MVPRISSNTVLGLRIPLLMRGPKCPNIERSIGRASRCLSRHFTCLFVIGKRLPNRSYLDSLSITVLKVSGECSVSAAYCKGPPGRDNPNLVSANWLGLADTKAVLVRESLGTGNSNQKPNLAEKRIKGNRGLLCMSFDRAVKAVPRSVSTRLDS